MDFRPDFQLQTPGILTVANNVTPQKDGSYATSLAAEASGYNSAVSAIGGVVGSRLLKTPTAQRLLVGTQSKLFEASGGGSWTDRSIAGDYALTGSNRWWFEQYGSETIALTIEMPTQTSSSGTFAVLTNAPKGKVACVQSGHLLIGNYNDGSAVPDGIAWCSQDDSTDWTPTASNTAGSIRLKQSPGPIIAMAPMHDIVVVWKARSMYLGKKIGGATTDVFRFNLFAKNVGCIHQEAWVDTPRGIIFVAETGIYLFDGSTIPQPIDSGVKIRLINSGLSAGSNIQMSHDEAQATVFIWNVTNTICYAYNYLSEKWGTAYAATTNLGSATLTTFTNVVRDANYNDANALAVSSPTFGKTSHLVFINGQKLVNLSTNVIANTFASTLQTGLARPEVSLEAEVHMDRVIPLWGSINGTVYEPSTGSVTVTPYSRISGASAAALANKTGALDTYKRFDVMSSAKGFVVALTMTNEFFCLGDIGYSWGQDGKR